MLLFAKKRVIQPKGMKKDSEKLTNIIKKCGEGNREAQKQLFELYSKKMLALCQRYTKDDMVAEDVLIDGFMKVYNNITKYEDRGVFDAWIKRIMINSCLDYLRDNKNNIVQEFDDNEMNYSFDISSDYAFSEEKILLCLKSLPNSLRVTFNLSAIDGYTNKEIADIMSTKVDIVKNNLCRAKKMLRDMLLEIKEKQETL